jgi:hypothetical protein
MVRMFRYENTLGRYGFSVRLLDKHIHKHWEELAF